MPVSLVDAQSLLAVNIGSSSTRAVLFDVVEGQYRFIASRSEPSTAEAPFKDITLGVKQAIAGLQIVTGKTLLDEDEQLITPSQADGSGVDSFAATISAGPILRAVVVGLLSDVSLESAQHLAETTYLHIVETFGLNDHRKTDEQIDAILRARPDIVLLAGGTDGGATRSMKKILEAIGLACFLMPDEKRPTILFAGNQDLTEEVRSSLDKLTPSLHFSPNVRPSLDTEDLLPASHEMARAYTDVRRRNLPGMTDLEMWAGGHILPTAYAEGRVIRFLSQMNGAGRGILSVDIGSTAAVIAAGFNGKLTLGVYPQFGLGENMPSLLNHTRLDDITRWLPLDISPAVVRDYLYQRAMHPSTIPATQEDHAIAHAIARQALKLSIRAAHRNFPAEAQYIQTGLLPVFEPILAGGGVLGDSPTPGQSLLLLLDALQPVGITSVILDQNNLLPLLGVAADINQLLPVQVLESGAFLSLGTIVSVISSTNYGTPVLRARLIYADGNEAQAEVKFGGLEILPLAMGQTARLQLQPLHRSNIGNGPGRNAAVQVTGGVMGVVIDARGRPLVLPEDDVRRRELIKRWLFSVGG